MTTFTWERRGLLVSALGFGFLLTVPMSALWVGLSWVGLFLCLFGVVVLPSPASLAAMEAHERKAISDR